MVIGGRFEVNNSSSSGIAKPVPECSWGAPAGRGVGDQLVAQGYCWNPFKNERGYGKLYFHVVKKHEVPANTNVLLGGHIESRSRDSTSPLHVDSRWGFDGIEAGFEGKQLLGSMYGWNPQLKSDGYLRFWGLIGKVPGQGSYTLAVLGGRMVVGDRTNSEGSRTSSLGMGRGEGRLRNNGRRGPHAQRSVRWGVHADLPEGRDGSLKSNPTATCDARTRTWTLRLVHAIMDLQTPCRSCRDRNSRYGLASGVVAVPSRMS